MGAMLVEYSTQYNKPGAQEGTQQNFILGGSAPAFSLRFYSYKMHVSLLSLFTDRNDRLPYPFISTSEIATLSYV